MGHFQKAPKLSDTYQRKNACGGSHLRTSAGSLLGDAQCNLLETTANAKRYPFARPRPKVGKPGVFSMLSAKRGINTVAIDNDLAVIDDLYNQIKKEGVTNILPLHVDISNPSAAAGWANKEKLSFSQRAISDVVIVLALIHHLTVSNNLTFDLIASFFHSLCKWLIIEFVPKEDPQFQKLLGVRSDIFSEYSQEKFEEVFGEYFTIAEKENIENSNRLLYLMKTR